MCVNERWVGLIECVWCGGDSVYIWEGANLRWFMNFSVCVCMEGVYVARMTVFSVYVKD